MSLDATLQNIVNSKLKWIFVGGKGGVGKSTTSSSIAIQLAKTKKSVLILSTDPAHNLSDVFDQKFSRLPTKVKGFTNLHAMEIDPNVGLVELPDEFFEEPTMKLNKNTLMGIANAMPGIDEAISYAEVMKLVEGYDFDVIVFDTAPTGHTLRFLSLPSVIEKSLSMVVKIKSQISPLISNISQMLGWQGFDANKITARLEEHLPLIKKINQQFCNKDLTTFICVCIPEFLSLYETERLVQELNSKNIDVNNIVVNQILMPGPNCPNCDMCKARMKIQKKYIDQIDDLYEDMHIVKLPLLPEEIRGPQNVEKFSEFLMKPYSPA